MTNKKTKKTNNKTRLNNFKAAINELSLIRGLMFNDLIKENGEQDIESYKTFTRRQILYGFMGMETLKNDTLNGRYKKVMDLYVEAESWLADFGDLALPDGTAGSGIKQSFKTIYGYLTWKYEIRHRQEGDSIITSMKA